MHQYMVSAVYCVCVYSMRTFIYSIRVLYTILQCKHMCLYVCFCFFICTRIYTYVIVSKYLCAYSIRMHCEKYCAINCLELGNILVFFLLFFGRYSNIDSRQHQCNRAKHKLFNSLESIWKKASERLILITGKCRKIRNQVAFKEFYFFCAQLEHF